MGEEICELECKVAINNEMREGVMNENQGLLSRNLTSNWGKVS